MGKLDFDAFILDLDGCIYRGDTLIPGADRAISALREKGIRILFLTNNSTETPEGFSEKLRSLGVNAPPSLILTSAGATAMYMRNFKRGKVYVVGETVLKRALEDEGFEIIGEGEAKNAKYVVSGLDRTLTYEKVAAACLAISRGAKYLATNGDKVLPHEDGYRPGAGAIISMIKAVTGKQPLIVGKPSKRIMTIALKKLGIGRKRTAIVGDVLGIDIVAGKRAGMFSILVLTGVSQKEDLKKGPIEPDLVLNSIHDLTAYL